MSKEERCIYNKKYRDKHKVDIALKKKAKRLENKVKIDLYNKNYHLKNIDKINLRQREFYLENHSRFTIRKWKQRGLISDDYDALYDYYISVKNCEICCVELTSGEKCKTRRAMDHDHKTGLFRNVLCDGCNLNLKE